MGFPHNEFILNAIIVDSMRLNYFDLNFPGTYILFTWQPDPVFLRFGRNFGPGEKNYESS